MVCIVVTYVQCRKRDIVAVEFAVDRTRPPVIMHPPLSTTLTGYDLEFHLLSSKSNQFICLQQHQKIVTFAVLKRRLLQLR